MEVARKLVLDESIEWPSADISFVWESHADASFIATMHFSRVVGLPERDLKLNFGRPLAVSWEDEYFDHIPTPSPIPRCTLPRLDHYAYPIIWVEGSAWADRYAASLYTEEEFRSHPVRHYLLVAMNDILHVLAKQPPVAIWVPSVDA